MGTRESPQSPWLPKCPRWNQCGGASWPPQRFGQVDATAGAFWGACTCAEDPPVLSEKSKDSPGVLPVATSCDFWKIWGTLRDLTLPLQKKGFGVDGLLQPWQMPMDGGREREGEKEREVRWIGVLAGASCRDLAAYTPEITFSWLQDWGLFPHRIGEISPAASLKHS